MRGIYFDPQFSDSERRARLYAGDLIVIQPTPASRGLVALAQSMLEPAFAPHDPRTAHNVIPAEETAAILAKLKPQFIHHPECKKLIPALMREMNIDLDKLYFDVPRLRSAFPGDYLSSGIAYAFHAHRDTWYSAPMFQINWWFPLLPITAENAMCFYPKYFSEPVRNNSEIYNYYEWNAKNRASAAQHIKSDTREQPKPQQPIEGDAITLLPPPGGIIMFSGAQLHATTPNTSDVTRYSIDFRTVHLDDVLGGQGAVNIDSRSTGTTMRDYLRASDLRHLPEEAIALYDDGTEAKGKVLYYGAELALARDIS